MVVEVAYRAYQVQVVVVVGVRQAPRLQALEAAVEEVVVEGRR